MFHMFTRVTVLFIITYASRSCFSFQSKSVDVLLDEVIISPEMKHKARVNKSLATNHLLCDILKLRLQVLF